MIRTHFEVGETAVTIIAEDEYIPAAKDSIYDSREVIQSFIEQDPFFNSTMEPYQVGSNAPALIQRMCAASQQADVGPMATVAGTIAEGAVKAMVDAGAGHAMVDNGGDIAMFLGHEVVIGLYTGDDRFSGIGFLCKPAKKITGTCTSSGTVGPSISLGEVDSATVFSDNVPLADACATRLGNEVKSTDEYELNEIMGRICSIPEILGAVVVVDGKMAMKGNIPRLVKSSDYSDKISRIEYS